MTNNISIALRGEVPECPPDAICSVGMDNGLVLIFLFIFFLGIIGGWLMHRYTEIKQRKNDMKIIDNPSWDKGATIEGVHEYSPSCEVYGCDGNHV